MLDTLKNGRRPKLLLMNYACSPLHGSEPGVGWNRAIHAARICDTWTIVEADAYQHQSEIEGYLAANGPVEGLQFVFLPHSPLERVLSKIPGCLYLAYNLWQRRAFRKALALDAKISFDLVHHNTLCGYREPGYVWKLGKPFIWGPTGGTQNYPWRFLGLAGARGAVKELSRNVVNWLQLRLSRRVRQAARSASTFLVVNSSVARAFQNACGLDPLVLPELGVRELRDTPRTVDLSRRTLRILWSGNLIPLKGLPVLLHALAQLRGEIDFEVRVLGSGYLQSSLQRQAEKLGIAPHVQFLGRLPLDQALSQRAWADVLVFTSLRDSSGNVVVEAMADGMPVIVFDHQGVGDIVTETCGIKIPVTTPRAAFAGFAAALRRFATHRELLQTMGAAALRRARIYYWPWQAARMAAIYRHVLGTDFLWDDEQAPRQPSYGHEETGLPECELTAGAAS